MNKLITILLVLLSIVNAEDIKYSTQDSPQNAMKLYFQSLKHGSHAKFKESIHASERFVNAMSKMVDLTKALQRYEKVVKSKFQNDKTVKNLINGMTGLDSFEKMSDSLKLKIDKNRAVSIPQQKGELAVNFIKIDNKWKLDYSIMESAQQGKLQILAMESAIPKIIEHIKVLEKKILTTNLHPKDFNENLSSFIMKTVQESALEVINSQKEANKNAE